METDWGMDGYAINDNDGDAVNIQVWLPIELSCSLVGDINGSFHSERIDNLKTHSKKALGEIANLADSDATGRMHNFTFSNATQGICKLVHIQEMEGRRGELDIHLLALCSGGYHYIYYNACIFLQIGTLAPSSMFVVEMVSPEKTSNLEKH